MKKQIALVLFLALMTSLLAVVAVAQPTSSIKGYCKDENGQPYAGGSVEFVNLDTGRKVKLTLDKKGEYFSMGVTIGKYDASLYDATGKQIFKLNKVTVAYDEKDNVYNFDMAKERKAGAGAETEEARKLREKTEKENNSIKGLNKMLADARAAREAKDFETSITIMQKATEIDATKDLLWAVLGDSYLGAKKYPEASEAYKKAIAIAPTKGEYHNNLGQALAKSGATEEAIKEYDAAAQADPVNAGMYYFNEGAVLTNRGKVDEANTAFDKAIAADPTRAEAYYQKGLNLLGKAGLNKDGSMAAVPGTAESLNKYLELAPTGSHAQEAKDMLAAIGSKVETTFGSEKKKSGKK